MHVTASCTGQALHSELCVEIKHASALSMSNAEYKHSFLCDQQHIACCDALLIAKQWVLKSILLPSASRCDVAAELWAGLINRLLQQRKLKHISLQGQQILSLEQAAQQMLPISSKPSDSGKLLNNDVSAVSCWARMMRGWAQCFTLWLLCSNAHCLKVMQIGIVAFDVS